jgi:O-antigen/teichoic acid export membrane protein
LSTSAAAEAGPALVPAGEALLREGAASEEGLLASVASRSLTGGAWALLTVGGGMAVAMARTLVVARLLGAREMGVMGIALLVLGTVEAFTATGVEAALVSHPGDVRGELGSAFAIQVARGALVAALIWAAAPLVASFFGTPAALAVTRGVAVTSLLRGLSNPAVLLLVKRIEFGRIFWWSLPELVAGFAVAVGVALVRHDVWALVAGAVAGQAASTLSSYLMVRERPGLRVSREGVRHLLGYGKWISGVRVLTWVSLSADNAVVGRLLGAGALGVYQLAFRVGELGVSTYTRAILQVALPALSQLHGSTQLGRGFRAALRLVLAANCAFALAMLLWARPLLAWLLGPEWLAAVPVLRILVVAMVFRAVVVLAGELFSAVRRPSISLQVNAVRVGVMLSTLVPLVYRYGMEGAAVSVLLASVVACVLSLWRARDLLDSSRH